MESLRLTFRRDMPRALGAVPNVFDTTRFDQPPVGPVLFLRANQFLDDWQDRPQECMVGQPP